MNAENKKNHKIQNVAYWQLLVFLLSVLLTFAFLTFQISLRKTSFSLKIGDVATADILAPRTITYESQILTEQAQNDAENMVGKIYLPADPTISRSQVQALRTSFQFITTVRDDSYATNLQKSEDLQALSFVRLDKTTINQLLSLSAEEWNSLQSEGQRILEQVMQNSIRDDQVITEIENIPTMINYNINPQVADLINGIVRRFVVPNSIYSEDLTEKNRQEARDAVQPRERKFVTNQTIVARGQIITELIYEALDQMGLVTSQSDGKRILSSGMVVIGLGLFALIFFLTERRYKQINLRETILIASLYIVFLLIARLLIPNRAIIPFIFPIQALGFTIACLNGTAYGAIISILIGILVSYDFPNAIAYTTFYIITSLAGIIVLKKARQMSNFLLAGLTAGLVGVPIIITYHITGKSLDMVGLMTLSGASIISGLLATGLTLIAQYSFSRFIGVATSLQLMEIIRPDSPLLQYLLNTAPGTYQHSLMVANLSEQAAKVIGADPLLVRAGAMYHDVGKSMNPSFFIENQVTGNINLHEDITPRESAANIIQHVYDGVMMVRKFHLPEVMEDFVREHHGTNVTRYQLSQAMAENSAEEVDIADFTYPGPCPKTKETALVMLADTCEARARADKPKDDEEISALVKSVFDYYSTNGQLDYAPLTLQDLTNVRLSFIKSLRNSYHPRVKYPEMKQKPRKIAEQPSAMAETK